eukprot:2292766-Pleurochrysis_carterae.AAC.3
MAQPPFEAWLKRSRGSEVQLPCHELQAGRPDGVHTGELVTPPKCVYGFGNLDSSHRTRGLGCLRVLEEMAEPAEDATDFQIPAACRHADRGDGGGDVGDAAYAAEGGAAGGEAGTARTARAPGIMQPGLAMRAPSVSSALSVPKGMLRQQGKTEELSVAGIYAILAGRCRLAMEGRDDEDLEIAAGIPEGDEEGRKDEMA